VRLRGATAAAPVDTRAMLGVLGSVRAGFVAVFGDLSGRENLDSGTTKMAEGTIKRLTDKGFGFIETGAGKDMFFHNSNVEGVTFEELREGQRVSFDAGEGPKGPRAENVRPI
jgi:CspA family cold shock protein